MQCSEKSRERERERRPGGRKKGQCNKTHGQFGQINKSNSPNSFLPILGRKLSGGSK